MEFIFGKFSIYCPDSVEEANLVSHSIDACPLSEAYEPVVTANRYDPRLFDDALTEFNKGLPEQALRLWTILKCENDPKLFLMFHGELLDVRDFLRRGHKRFYKWSGEYWIVDLYHGL